MKKKTIYIFGAGAIGRGYLPWVYDPKFYDYVFFENDTVILNLFKKYKSYESFIVKNNKYISKKITPIQVFSSIKDISDIDIFPDMVITAVGPRNIFDLMISLKSINRSYGCPIICFENEIDVVKQIHDFTGIKNVYFGIPDVVSSNTAPPDLLKENPLNIVTENGVTFVDDSVNFLQGNVKYLSSKLLNEQWLAKLYIHNTSHCIAAYLGYLINSEFIHDAMKNNEVRKIVEGSMNEVSLMLNKKFKINNNFINFYSNKELDRFKNPLLFDPVSRVAREPFRKLSLNGRLIGGAQHCLASGIIPTNILKGIMAAIFYDFPSDPDYHIDMLIKSLNPSDFLELVLGLDINNPLFQLLIDSWDENLTFLKKISIQ